MVIHSTNSSTNILKHTERVRFLMLLLWIFHSEWQPYRNYTRTRRCHLVYILRFVKVSDRHSWNLRVRLAIAYLLYCFFYIHYSLFHWKVFSQIRKFIYWIFKFFIVYFIRLLIWKVSQFPVNFLKFTTNTAMCLRFLACSRWFYFKLFFIFQVL